MASLYNLHVDNTIIVVKVNEMGANSYYTEFHCRRLAVISQLPRERRGLRQQIAWSERSLNYRTTAPEWVKQHVRRQMGIK